MLTMLGCWASAETVLQDCQNSLQQGDYEQAKAVCENSLKAVTKDSTDEMNIMLYLIGIYHHLQNDQKLNYFIQQTYKHPTFNENTAAQYDWHRKVGQKFYFDADFFKSQRTPEPGFPDSPTNR